MKRPRASSAPREPAILSLFAVTLFCSAFLLFWVQPLFAKMILPLFGGSPAVWNTCMVFFQTALLAGYLYADRATRRLKPPLQLLLHFVLLLAVLPFLPLAVPDGWAPPGTVNPVPRLMLLLAAAVGVPAFALSSTAPLVQAWFARSGHAAARDPYFLYGASNLGSLLALLGYPTVIEPHLALQTQSRLWTGVFLLLALCLLGCALVVRRSPPAGAVGGAGAAAPAAATLRQKGTWLALSFVPSSLLLGVTTHMTTDVAAVPLLWVVPFALYLATFVITFSRRPLIPPGAALAAQPLFLLALGVVFFLGDRLSLLAFPAHLLAFFSTALVCHGALAASRPPAASLTTFYLWLSLGGVLGGVFNALLAPLLFTTVAEYPLVIVAAVLLRPNLRLWESPRPWLSYLIPAGILALLALGGRSVRGDSGFSTVEFLANLGLALLAAAAVFLVRARPVGLALGIGALIVAGQLTSPAERTLHRERSFFGVLRVADADGRRLFYHGQTIHGAQSLDPAERRTPQSYYSPEGPLGEIFAAYSPLLPGKRIAVAGLGAGATAAYGLPGLGMDFYELDPGVVRIARDIRYFTYLADSQAAVTVSIGDARLKLAEAPDGAYALIVVDVFSSDAIPAHMLTREALRSYLRKLTPGGILAFHVTNAYLDLEPVVHSLAADAGLISAIRRAGGRRPGSDFSAWAVMARDLSDLAPLRPYPEWYRTKARPGAEPWTDSFSNVFSAFRFR